MDAQAEAGDVGAVGYTLRFDRKQRVLLITFGKVARQSSLLAAYDAVTHFVAAEGSCSVIADLSKIEKAEVTGDFVRSMAWMPRVLPPRNQR